MNGCVATHCLTPPLRSAAQDISGFSALNEHFAQQGGDGLGQMMSLVNMYFQQMIKITSAFGGDGAPPAVARVEGAAKVLVDRRAQIPEQAVEPPSVLLPMGGGGSTTMRLVGCWASGLGGAAVHLQQPAIWAAGGLVEPRIGATHARRVEDLLLHADLGALFDDDVVRPTTINEPPPAPVAQTPSVPETTQAHIEAAPAASRPSA